MKIDDDKFNKIKREAEACYSAIRKVRCPYLKDEVHFNREGFEHLFFKSWNKTRTRKEQYVRLRLLRLVQDVVSKSHTLQEYNECKLFVRQKINSRWEKQLKTVRYYVFIAIIREKIRLKVIVKEIEGGVKFFYSLYPSWKVVIDGGGSQRKILYSGDLETD